MMIRLRRRCANELSLKSHCDKFRDRTIEIGDIIL